MQPSEFFSQAYAPFIAHAWWALAALAIGAVVRLLKDDQPLPVVGAFTLPPQYRGWAALVLGLISGVIQAIATGTPWFTAILQGLGAGAAAITGHQTIVEGMRGGREFFSGGAAKAGAAAAAAKIAGSVLFAFLIAGCAGIAKLPPQDLTRIGLDLKDLTCVLMQDELGQSEPKAVALACSIPSSQIEYVIDALVATKKGKALAAAAKMGATAK